MLIPYSTDAPLYHFPWVTIGLISVNVAASVACLVFLDGDWGLWMLEFGRLRPHQWLTSNFVHFGLLHLIGNMLFLWGFGIVVEGKLGWWRMLVVYLGVGVIECAVTQVAMLMAQEGGAGGASGAISALMVMCILWAPLNNAQVVFVFHFYFIRTFNAPYWALAGFFVGYDVLMVLVNGFSMSTSLLHLLGAMIGAGVGVAMLTFRLVDCERWDLFSVIVGRHRSDGYEPWNSVKTAPAPTKLSIEATLRELELHLQEGRPELAEAGRQMLMKTVPEFQLAEPLHRQIINGLFQKQRFAQSISVLSDYRRTFVEQRNWATLQMAEAMHYQGQSPVAAEFLKEIDASSLSATDHHKMRQLAESIRRG